MEIYDSLRLRTKKYPYQSIKMAWHAEALCGETFGPADYITLASTFRTLILDNVHILQSSQKNAARRLVTLLDAHYEAHRKLIIHEPLFPETQESSKGTDTRK